MFLLGAMIEQDIISEWENDFLEGENDSYLGKTQLTLQNEFVSPSNVINICRKIHLCLSFEDQDEDIQHDVKKKQNELAKLLMQGELSKVRNILVRYVSGSEHDNFFIVDVMNCTPIDTYCGTLLHVLLYHNNTEDAFNLYKFMIEHGAIPVKNYYEEMPYEQNGCYWIFSTEGIDFKMGRNFGDFAQLYERIKEFHNQQISNLLCL